MGKTRNPHARSLADTRYRQRVVLAKQKPRAEAHAWFDELWQEAEDEALTETFTDDLSERLKWAADRIEQLEAALREVDDKTFDPIASRIARAALARKHDDPSCHRLQP
jgi:alpha-D-ribose 1-methylphosphonate 5-triphosphate synthase subunit PhnG